MQLSTDEFFNIQSQLSAKDIQIAGLQREVDRLTKENERLRQHACTPSAGMQTGSQFIILSLDKVCRVLRNLSDVRLISFLFTALRKMMPADASPEAIRQITDSISLDTAPAINISAEGDVNVAGNLNHVHDNEQVNF